MRSGVLIRRARERAGMTQSELSRRSGVRQSTISLYENGAREPGADTFIELVAATGAVVEARRFTDEEVRRGEVLADVIAFGDALPHQWKEKPRFPHRIWGRRTGADGRG